MGIRALLSASDVVSLHCPLTPETKGLLSREAIASMKDGAILLNTARGGLVDEAALAEALRSGKLAGAGLDVAEHEPMAADSPLIGAPNLFITPHIAWASRECRQRIMDTTERNIAAFLAGTPINVVN